MGALCAANIFRTSFSNWQPAFRMGKVVADRGLKRAVTLTWQYAAGEESVGGFKEGFTAAGGGAVKLVKDYAAAGLNDKIALVGPGILTDGTLPAQGEAAQGLETTLRYGDAL